MTRLAIIDVAGGWQPIYNESGTLAMVCNGEIYNYMSLRCDLERAGHRFRTSTDTEVLVHLYEDLGEGFAARGAASPFSGVSAGAEVGGAAGVRPLARS